MIRFRGLSVCVLGGFVALASTNAALAQYVRSNPPIKAKDIELVPVGRWVSPTDRRWFADRTTFDRFSDYRDQIRERTFKYDNIFRNPLVPDGPTPVNCANARRIGISLAVTARSAKRLMLSGSRTLLDVRWTHSDIELRDREVERKVDRRDGLYSAGLSIVDHNRADGLYTVTVSYRGTDLYRTAFDVRGCERS